MRPFLGGWWEYKLFPAWWDTWSTHCAAFRCLFPLPWVVTFRHILASMQMTWVVRLPPVLFSTLTSKLFTLTYPDSWLYFLNSESPGLHLDTCLLHWGLKKISPDSKLGQLYGSPHLASSQLTVLECLMANIWNSFFNIFCPDF